MVSVTHAARKGGFFLRALDARVCWRLNRLSGSQPVRAVFASVSRLGDGIAWYGLMAVLAVTQGPEGAAAALQMAMAGILGLALYRFIKARTTRLRPYMVHPAILARIPPLDRYSFPSGHTLQAVSLSLVACTHFPVLAWVLVPFTAVIALSRPVLGLHFPSDVIFGAACGAGIAALVVSS